MYLPPEVIRGGMPTLAADAWALGCLQYQLLAGKPPIWVESESEEDLKSRIVGFTLSDDQHLAALPEPAQLLITRLLEVDVGTRLPVVGAAGHQFFDGVDVFRLYTKPRGPEIAAANRSAKSSGDERWQKRQFSKIWTVMPSPEDYQLPTEGATAGGRSGAAGAKTSGPPTSIPETALEANSPFMDDIMTNNDLRMARGNVESL